VKEGSPLQESTVVVEGVSYPCDEWTTISPRIAREASSKLHLSEGHPLSLMRRFIADHFHREGQLCTYAQY
jgi:hypothetical protein